MTEPPLLLVLLVRLAGRNVLLPVKGTDYNDTSAFTRLPSSTIFYDLTKITSDSLCKVLKKIEAQVK